MCEEERRHCSGVSSLLLPCGLWGSNSGHYLNVKGLHPPSHLTSPTYHFRSQTNHHVDLDGVTAEAVIAVSSSVKRSSSHSCPALICQRQENGWQRWKRGPRNQSFQRTIYNALKYFSWKGDAQHPATWLSQERKGFAMQINLPSGLQEREEPCSRHCPASPSRSAAQHCSSPAAGSASGSPRGCCIRMNGAAARSRRTPPRCRTLSKQQHRQVSR